MTVGIKICGLCEVGDAVAAVEAGATAVGLNLIASSKRFIELPLAAAIVAEVGAQVRTVVVVADLTAAEIESIRQRVRPNYVQLHGSESAALLAAVLPGAYKAIRIADRGDVAAASEFAGEELLVDAKVPGASGDRHVLRLVGGVGALPAEVHVAGWRPDPGQCGRGRSAGGTLRSRHRQRCRSVGASPAQGSVANEGFCASGT